MVEMNCQVFGKVQGVAYRTYVQESATQLGIVGYVKNLPDGSVEILAQGQPDILKEFVEYLNEGSIMSRVDSLAVEWGTIKRSYSEFFFVALAVTGQSDFDQK